MSQGTIQFEVTSILLCMVSLGVFPARFLGFSPLNQDLCIYIILDCHRDNFLVVGTTSCNGLRGLVLYQLLSLILLFNRLKYTRSDQPLLNPYYY